MLCEGRTRFCASRLSEAAGVVVVTFFSKVLHILVAGAQSG